MTRTKTSHLMSRRDLDYLMFEWLDVESLLRQTGHDGHDRQLVGDLLDLAQELATEHFAPHNRRNDLEEPQLVDGVVRMHDEVAPALAAYFQAGFAQLSAPAEAGGADLPATVSLAADIWFTAANPTTAGFPMLTRANAHLLLAHADREQIDTWVTPMLEGRYFGTMCLSEPQAGSSLSDISTHAHRADDGTYRVRGTKMWISGGDHELAENIVHLVLARTSPDQGVRGLSLFIVPKVLQDGRRNDVTLVGLNHKLGMRGIPNAVLSFGDSGGAVGYLVGAEGGGLSAMFHMMNEARLAVGTTAVALGYSGYLQALDYARQRVQGRALGSAAGSPPVAIIEHPDVRRMLLMSKSYVEGGLALALLCARLLDEERFGDDPHRAHLLLELLTPIAKSWPAQWCLVANDLAIQIHGGSGYTRDFAVEQLWRDNRLNPIHEGTHGIQSLDLLGRKISLEGGAALRHLEEMVRATVARARHEDWGELSSLVEEALDSLLHTTYSLLKHPDRAVALSRSSTYLEAFGHVVVAWVWLDVALSTRHHDEPYHAGKRLAAAHFIRIELATNRARIDELGRLESTLVDLDPSLL
ncbi:acyl-CoA dehydrogenase [Amycolatopsis panacis]|uniref:Acyl-CoA dehydrogenase n=1 Tax=Amycolatopsis panacis TaxID=2340917 RepID=A0A419I2K0_9PSEU|nr:acyl-CoA dehydrogenase [Amycolatopsis panacis]RJQ84188.1 acyl-CoA dehydrogenase [Amycolatopsis panacis]